VLSGGNPPAERAMSPQDLSTSQHGAANANSAKNSLCAFIWAGQKITYAAVIETHYAGADIRTRYATYLRQSLPSCH
jgi:hypothetical protein